MSKYIVYDFLIFLWAEIGSKLIPMDVSLVYDSFALSISPYRAIWTYVPLRLAVRNICLRLAVRNIQC